MQNTTQTVGPHTTCGPEQTTEGDRVRTGRGSTRGRRTGTGTAAPTERTARPGARPGPATAEHAAAQAGRDPHPTVPERPPPRRGRSTTNSLGRYGEQVAARRLAADGLRILDRNWRCTEGELDIVALDGDTLAVCEVKTRSERGFQQPSEAIDGPKAERLQRLAERWLAERWGHHFARLAAEAAGPGAWTGADTGTADEPEGGGGGARVATTEPSRDAPTPPGGVRIDLIAVVNRVRGAASVDHLRGVI